MTWSSETYYWTPAVPFSSNEKSFRENSLHLSVDDGFRCRLEMDDCQSVERDNCECEGMANYANPKGCGWTDYCCVDLSIDDLIALRGAVDLAIAELQETQLGYFRNNHTKSRNKIKYLVDSLLGKVDFDQKRLDDWWRWYDGKEEEMV